MVNKKHIAVTVVITFLVSSIFYFTIGGTGVYSLLTAGGGDNAVSGKIRKINTLLDRHYINDYDTSEMEKMALNAYVYGVGDPYTAYIDEDNYADMQTSIDGDYVGIGVEVYVAAEDGLITVISCFDDSPAQKAGLQPGDKLLAVEGTEAGIDNYYEIINMIKGVTPTSDPNSVTMTIGRGDQTMDVTVQREKITTETVKERMLTSEIGYIRISSFDQHTDQAFTDAAERLKAQNMQKLVIDLRGNPGGLLEAVVGVADYLLPEGKIITVRDKQGREQVYESDADALGMPIAVLVNGSSASASEVLAGAIRDHDAGTLVGEKTFGKGLVQSIYEFGDGTAMKITTAKYYTPSGECIDQIGITPAVEVALPAEAAQKPIQNLTLDEDTQLQRAMEILLQK